MKIFFLIISFIFLYANDNNLTELNMTKKNNIKIKYRTVKKFFLLNI
ncbi:hypothetical protein [Lebetimonas sp. JS032]|nr:hypothetical protein [Lebetimonas sp. JS032]